MKPRQKAILETVRRWATIVVTGEDPGNCALCMPPGCSKCPYVEVYDGRRCVDDFPELAHEGVGRYNARPRVKLRRAMTLARRYTVGDQAVEIVREVFRGPIVK